MKQKFAHIDLSYLQKHSQGNRSIEKQMLTIYLKEIPEAINKLNIGLLEKNWFKIGKAAHRAKSILPTIGLVEAANDLTEIDRLCRKSENPDEVQALIAGFEKIGNASLTEINQALEDYHDI